MTREKCIEILGWLKTPVDYDEVVTLISRVYDDFEEDLRVASVRNTTTIKPKQPQYSFMLVEGRGIGAFEREVEKCLNNGYKLFDSVHRDTTTCSYSVFMIKEF